MHLDRLFARRTQAGAPVVHGIHAVLWALEALAEHGLLERPLARIEVRFRYFVYVGGEVTLRVVRSTESKSRVELVAEGLATTTIDVIFGARSEAPIDAPRAAEVESAPARSGSVRLEPGRLAPLFPILSARIGAMQIEALGGLSYLVGMQCPGLHSIFSAFSVAFYADDESHAAAPVALTYRVASVDDRVRLVEIAVTGGGIAGTVEAFSRQPPVAQRTFADVRRVVTPDEFAGATALVIGGSRGLGAVTARIVAAGGGRAVVTYAVGEADARDVAAEIGAERCTAMRYDVRDDAEAQLAALPWPVDRLYYFASTHIHRQSAALFAAERFGDFCAVYVDGFERVASALRSRCAAEFRAFYPSSVALDDRPRGMTEYAMAKAAGELLCADLNRFVPATNVLVRRLPRVLTDQTATVMPVESSDALDVMLPIVREMHRALGEPVR